MGSFGYLFRDSDLRAVLEGQEKRVYELIDAIDGDEFLNTSPEDLADYYVREYTFDVPVLDEDAISIDHGETKIDVSQDHRRAIWDRSQPLYLTGTEVTFYIPFEGDKGLFTCRPSSSYTNWPKAQVRENELVMVASGVDPDASSLSSQFDRERDMVRDYLGWIAADVRPFNDSLPEKIRNKIEARREKLLADRGLAASLGFKMRERTNAARTYAVPAKRRPSPARPRPKTTAPYEPEQTLPEDEYTHILSILSNMVEVMERSSKSFKTMDEEALRTQFLVQLNGQYEGGASGETFNAEGKTDILIRSNDRTVFIAECKFWKGPASLTKAIDQLLSYTSWRDTKTALLVFNRGGTPLTKVLEKIPEVVRKHPNFKREGPVEGDTRFRYDFAHRDDPQRELNLTVMAFEVPN